MNFAKFLRTPFLQNTYDRLLLYNSIVICVASHIFSKDIKQNQRTSYFEEQDTRKNSLQLILIGLDSCLLPLKLVSAIFYQVFIFSPNDSPLKTMKNVFYFISKALFVLEIFRFLHFFPFLSTLSRFKRTNGRGIIYDVMN